MVSTTSGTTTFFMDVDDIIEEALEPLGGDWSSGVEQSKARRALNLILIELENKRIPLHKIEEVSVSLNSNTQEYVLNNSISDVLECTLKTIASGTEYPLERWGLRDFHQIPNKNQTNRPTLFTTERHKDGVTLKIWPVPNVSATWTAELLAIKRIEDITASYQRIDLPYRYYPLLVAWLSYKLSLSKQGIDETIKTRLKNELVEIMTDTFDEDRERVDIQIKPGGISGR